METVTKKDIIKSAHFTLPLKELNWDYTRKYEEKLRSQDSPGILQSEYDGVTRLARFYAFVDLLNLKLGDVSFVHLNPIPLSGKMDDSANSMGKPLFFSLIKDVPEYKILATSNANNIEGFRGYLTGRKNKKLDHLMESIPFSAETVERKVEENTIILPYKSGSGLFKNTREDAKNAKTFEKVHNYIDSILDRGKVPVIFSEYLFGSGSFNKSSDWGDEFLSLKGVHLHYVSLLDMAHTLDWTKGRSRLVEYPPVEEDYFTRLHEKADMPRNKFKDSFSGAEHYTYYALTRFAEPRKPSEIMIHWNKY